MMRRCSGSGVVLGQRRLKRVPNLLLPETGTFIHTLSTLFHHLKYVYISYHESLLRTRSLSLVSSLTDDTASLCLIRETLAHEDV